jgi:hypothetical protein
MSYAETAKKGRDTGRIEKPKEKRLFLLLKEGHRVIIQIGDEEKKKRVNKLLIKEILA